MHYAVIDEEFCNVVPGARTSDFSLNNELIQIGVVLLDEEFNEVSRFNEYIKPEHGHVDAFIRRLTGITQYTVSKVDVLGVVLERLKQWLPEDAVMVSWSTADLHQLRKEMEQKGIDDSWLEEKYDTWIDCQKIFSRKIDDIRQYSLEEALNMSDIYTEGDLHDGLSDAINTAKLFKKLNTEKEFKTSERYIKAKEAQESVTFSLGDLLSKLNIPN